MSVLSAQTIRRLCFRTPPLIAPFSDLGVFDGKSYGLSACSYDVRIARRLRLGPGDAALASTIERFCLPANLCGSVFDRSSYPRVFVSAFNTHLDPGFEGYLTVELVNLGRDTVIYEAGAPVCQIRFEFLDEPAEVPCGDGKYQPDWPVGAVYGNG